MPKDSFQQVHDMRRYFSRFSTPFSMALRKTCDTLDELLSYCSDEDERLQEVKKFRKLLSKKLKQQEKTVRKRIERQK